MSTSPPAVLPSTSAQVDRTCALKLAGMAISLLMYLHHVLQDSTPGTSGGGASPGGARDAAHLALACALAALAGSTIAFAIGEHHETLRGHLAAFSAVSCAVAAALLVAPHGLAHPEALGLPILIGCAVAAVACYGKYNAFWAFAKGWVRS